MRAVSDRPYEWMTMSCLEFDGDSHTRKADWFGMTRSDGPTNSQFVYLLSKTDKHIVLNHPEGIP